MNSSKWFSSGYFSVPIKRRCSLRGIRIIFWKFIKIRKISKNLQIRAVFDHFWSPSKRHDCLLVCFCKQPIYQKLQFCRIQIHMIPSQKWASPAMPLGSWKQPASTTMDAADGSCSPSFVGFEISKTWTPFSSSSVLKKRSKVHQFHLHFDIWPKIIKCHKKCHKKSWNIATFVCRIFSSSWSVIIPEFQIFVGPVSVRSEIF